MCDLCGLCGIHTEPLIRCHRTAHGDSDAKIPENNGLSEKEPFQ